MTPEQESPLVNKASNDVASSTPDNLAAGPLVAALSTSSDVDYFKVTTNGPALIRVELGNALTDATAHWNASLVNAAGDYLSLLNTTVLGTPTVKTAPSASTTSLEVQGLSSAIPVGARFSFASEAADTTIYTVTGATALSAGVSTLTLDQAVTSTTAPAALALKFDPAQVTVAGGTTTFTAQVSAAGTYFVKVNASNWVPDDYTVKATVLPTTETSSNDDTAGAAASSNNRLLANAWMNGALSVTTDKDVWVFTTATLPSDLTLSFEAPSGDASKAQWQVQVQQWTNSGLVAVRTAGGSTLATKTDAPATTGTAASFTIEKGVPAYGDPSTFVVTVSAVSSSAYSSGAYRLKLSGSTIDLNDTPQLVVDTVSSSLPGLQIPTGVVRALRASTDVASSKMALPTLFSASDADSSQSLSYRLVLNKTAEETGAVAATIEVMNAAGTAVEKTIAMSAVTTLTAAEMSRAWLVAGATTGNLTLSLQALDSTSAPDDSGSSSVMQQTLRIVSANAGVNISHEANLTLTEGVSGSQQALVIALSEVPTANVNVFIEQDSSNRLNFGLGSAGTSTTQMLTFTPEDFAGKTVVVQAIDNQVTESAVHTGQIRFRVVSDDPTYNGNNPTALNFDLSDPSNASPTGSLTLHGVAKKNQLLDATPTSLADADELGTLGYAWQRSTDNKLTWSDIASASSSTYALTSDDVGTFVRAQVKYLDGKGHPEVVSSAETTLVLNTGYSINAHVKHWLSNADLNGVALTKSGVIGAGSNGTLALAEVADTDGTADDGIMTLLPSRTAPESKATSGVTLTDVLGSLKVYLGKSLSTNDSPFKYITSDFDGNGTVNLTDVLTLLKYYLGKDTAGVRPQWVFVDSNDITTVSGVVTSIADGTSSPISKTSTLPHDIDHNFNSSPSIELVGILRGDVDGSWTPPVT